MFDATAFVYSSTGLPLQHPFDDYYFSFVTLTTTGFGDIVPNSQVARSFVTIEAITGLFYLAILVAHLATLVRPPEAKS